MAYSLDNPHPAHGKDPNIVNEFGHTDYPKWIDHPTEKTKHSVVKDKEIPLRVLVNNKKEEDEVLGKGKAVDKQQDVNKDKPKGWDK